VTTKVSTPRPAAELVCDLLSEAQVRKAAENKIENEEKNRENKKLKVRYIFFAYRWIGI
jgi:hypothetical protein